MTLKQIFQIENISYICMIFCKDCWKIVIECFIFVFVTICCFSCCSYDLCCWTQRCGLLSRIRLKITNQVRQTSPNESVLHFWFVFVACWRQIGKLVQVVCITVSLFSRITQTFIISSFIDDVETNLAIGKHTLGAFAWHFEEIVGKSLLRCFIYVFYSICCISCHFNNLCCWTKRCGLHKHFKATKQSW